MIHANRIVTVGEQESIIDRPVILYRGDREVEIEFTLVGNEFTFSEEGNIIKSVNASHGQLVLNTPSGEHMFSELAECHEGKVVFVVTKEMIDEFIEIGLYSFQIRLYDSAEMKSRVTIPPVLNGFDIRNPIAAEDETNAVDQGIVDYSRISKDQSDEELPTFDWTGSYNKTEWVHHDTITVNKMNKIEDALYSINANVKESDVVMRNTLDQVKNDADTYVKEHMAEVEADVEEFERNLNTGVEQFKIDTNAAMTVHKNEVSEELESFDSQLACKINNELFYDVKTEKFRHSNGTDYYITEIPFSIKPKIGIAKGGVGNVQSTLEFAREQRASLCINAGVFDMTTNIPRGSVMINGVIFTDVIYTNTSSMEILAIDDNGMLASFDSNNHTATSLKNEGYNNCVQGWYPFIKDGEYMNNRSTTTYNPLQAIGQKANGDYVIFTCDGRTHYDKGMSIPEAAEVLLSYDVVYAYNLDGGGSTSTVNKLIKQNKNIDDMVDDRLVPTFIYFEKETIDNDVFNAFEEIARLKQEINEKLVEITNIEKGFLRLKGKSGFYYPGIEFFQDDDDTRMGKVLMSKSHNFRVLYADEGTEKEVLGAKLDGLYDVNGKLADFHRMPTLITDCNAVRGSGVFKTNASTLNKPMNLNIGFLIQFDYDDDTYANCVQIFLAKDTPCICYREIFANGSAGDWMNCSNICSDTRPDDTEMIKGFTMFDSSINKLIIYKGDGVWVDCNGTIC